MINFQIEHPILYTIIQIFKIIFLIGICIIIICWVINDLKKPTNTISEYEILSISYMKNTENTSFTIGNDGENFVIYTEKNSDGGVDLEKYKIDLTTIYKTLSENQKSYVKINEHKYKGIIKVEIFVPENAIIEAFTEPIEEKTEPYLTILSRLPWICCIISCSILLVITLKNR